jgi:hypothetical protein
MGLDLGGEAEHNVEPGGQLADLGALEGVEGDGDATNT